MIDAVAFSDLVGPDEKGVRTFAYKDGKDEKVLTFSSGLDLARKLVESLPAIPGLNGTQSAHKAKATPDSAKVPGQDTSEIEAKAKAYSEKHPDASYRDAVMAVLGEGA